MDEEDIMMDEDSVALQDTDDSTVEDANVDSIIPFVIDRYKRSEDYRYQEVKLQYAKYLSELIRFFSQKEIKSLGISDDIIFECSMVTKKTCNMIPYTEDRLYFLNCTQQGLIDEIQPAFEDYPFDIAPVTAVSSFDINQSIIEDLKAFFSSMEKSIGDIIIP